MNYPIDKNIPAPAGYTVQEIPKYPFMEMQVGDSFFVPSVKQSTMGGYVAWAGRILHRRFTAREVDGGVRVWRIK